MPGSPAIRILADDNNRRGDLFGRLMADLLIALGYEQPHLNVHKSGRELDLVAEHRLEPRRAVAECKATAQPIGGADLNKLVGAIDAEHDAEKPLTGYFISLSGFTESALEQERRRRRTTIVTLDGFQVVEELVRGRILVTKDRAAEMAGRLLGARDDLVFDGDAELLAHERGWIWAVYYTRGKARTHFALIHSDGTPLARVIADEVIAADRRVGGTLHELASLNPAPVAGVVAYADVEAALAAYRKYLADECGYVHLDGLPADGDVGTRRLRLENLFVPAHIEVVPDRGERAERREVGAVLLQHPRMALLAAPGGGKSTLVKRLAIAYSDPARRKQVADDLPERDWLPLFFRCRELRGLARGSFAELLQALSQREGVRHHARAFLAHVDRELLAGRVLLLVDGLDEIADPGDRAAFVSTLRATLHAYPGVAMVVTSREAGFRHVAAHLAAECARATLSPFDADDIRRLCVAWHQEVVGDTEKIRADAAQLAETIARNDRIQRLAVNPLLLTTLLLVKRWVGSLPTRRAVLYGEAVKVLLRTWNTEGHDPIPEEEALPQLCYVASAMMLRGVQKISRSRLADLLQEARDALPTELGFVTGTVDQFIQRVEERSSLLMMTGHDVEDGQLAEFFEFRHLTFQEFLTAKAMVEGWHPGRRDTDTLLSVLRPHFLKEEWREVIPLAAVLGGKATEAFIQGLLGKAPIDLLANCLADEAAARPETIRDALHFLVLNGRFLDAEEYTPLLARGRYGAEFRKEAGKAFLHHAGDFLNTGIALAGAVWWQTVDTLDQVGYAIALKQLRCLLEYPEPLAQCEGALGCVHLFHDLTVSVERDLGSLMDTEDLEAVGHALVRMAYAPESARQFAASFALVGLGASRLWTPPADPDLLGRLLLLWHENGETDVGAQAIRALANQRLAPRDDAPRCASIPMPKVGGTLQNLGAVSSTHYTAALVIAWYLRARSDAELYDLARGIYELVEPMTRSTLRELMDQTGESRSAASATS